MDRQTFENLNPDEQAKVFHACSLTERGELLSYAHDPEQLTRSLSQEELYLVTREMDLEDRSEILKYATVSQLFFVSDIDCWRHDRIHPKHFIHWLETLERADERRLFVWLAEMDFETVVAGFKQIVEILKPEWEYAADELLGDRPYFTLDQLYYVTVSEENFLTVKRALELLFEHHRGRYTALVESIISEVDDQVEEEAYRKRGNRLADRGFPDPETAQQVYRPMGQAEFDKFPKKGKPDERPLEEIRMPHYLTLWQREQLFLDEVLTFLQKEPLPVLEGLQEELAWLANKVIAAEGIDFSSEERIRHGVERARDLVSLGLELLSGRDIAKAAELARGHWLETLFRRALTLHAGMRSDAQRIAREHWHGDEARFLNFLNAPYDHILKGAMRRLPECYDPGHKDEAYPWRDFRNLDELQKAQRAVDQLERLHLLLKKYVPKLFEMLEKEWDEDSADHPTLFSVLGTLLVSWTERGKMTADPLTAEEIRHFWTKAMVPHGSQRRIQAEIKENFLDHWMDAEEQALLMPVWALVFQELEEEIGHVPESGALQMRFLRVFRVQAKSARLRPKSKSKK